ncbi:MAG: transcriptional regulator [Candidatus Lumbricidophila eiseniae]|uniref:Transcriptional regulator n=1 Tax=Candidatus Lumbricidiphila eiseniae TaxID=1969409 RepID=A0A2A6FT24_9MICO|nr:MAG: transcriptional regulator [Candidatus Lumbricidophila eiseniae]
MSFIGPTIRNPDVASRSAMTRRAWWLVALNVLIPGAPQVLAGSRGLGRFGLRCTFMLWLVAIAALAVFIWQRSMFISIVANAWVLWAVTATLAFYAVLWLILTLDTLRLVRIVRIAPKARVWVAIVPVLVLVALSGTVVYAASVTSTASGVLDKVFVAGPSVPPENGRYNVLLMGGDAGPDRQGMRPDSITLVSVDAATGSAVTIGMPRELTNIPLNDSSPLKKLYPDGYGTHGCNVDACLLNSIYTEVQLKSPELYPDATQNGSSPGIEGMRDAVEGITGLKIQFYLLVDMAAFSQLVDALGGVTVSVTDAVPIHADDTFTTVAEWIKAGTQKLDGYHALWYARSRHGSSDYARMQRQRQLEQAMLAEFTPLTLLTKYQAIAAASAELVKTDIPQSMLGFFVDLAGKAKTQKLTDVPLTPDNNVDADEPDYGYIRTLVRTAVYPTPSPTPAG